MKTTRYKTSAALIVMAMMFGLVANVDAAKIANGKKVTFDYVLTVEGQVVDSTEGKEPLAYTQGASDIIPGLESALEGLEPGDSKSVTIQPEDAYGEINPEAITELPMERFPEEFDAKVGMVLQFNDEEGKTMPAVVSEVKDESVVVSFNHPLAGKTLNFNVEVVSVD